MAKYRKKPVVIEAEVYRYGLEDGFRCLAYGKKKSQNVNSIVEIVKSTEITVKKKKELFHT